MVGILIEMKLAALRRSLATTRVTWIATGAIAGVAAAAGLLLLATADGNEPTTVGSLLAVAFALYGLGWVLGPVSGGEPVLRPAQFRLLPIPPRTLAAGLLAAGAVGVGAAVTLLAFVSLVVYGARLGAVPALLAALAVVPQLAGLLVLARIAGAVFGRLATSRLGGAAVGVATAGLLLATQSGWVVIERAGRVLDAGMPAVLEGVVRALPSGWGVVAVEAAHRADWPLAIGALGGLLTLGALLFVVWARMVADPEAGRATIRGSSRAPWDRVAGAGTTGAVVAKELRTWARDPLRISLLVVGPVFALLTSLIPVIYGSTVGLPWAGATAALIATAVAANLYGQDGTALWLTVLAPGSVRADIRGRQYAWLLAVGPLSIAMTIGLTAASGQTWAWPWALAILASLVGAGAGLIVLVGVTQLVPGPDPRDRVSALDHGDTTGQGIFALFAALLLAAPAALVVLAGTMLDVDLVRWVGVPVGIGLGLLWAWALGRVAIHRLGSSGPDLVQQMRTGRAHATPSTGSASAVDAMSGPTKTWFFTLIWVGSIALFPQGLVPLVLALIESDTKVWFLALYLDDPWRWLTIAVMVLVGLLAYWMAAQLYRRATRSA